MQLLEGFRKCGEPIGCSYWQLLEGFRKCGELYWMQLLPIATTSSICGDSIGSTYWQDSVNAENYWQFCREMRDPAYDPLSAGV